MINHKFLQFSLLFSATCSFAAERPNVILILTDDQGWGDVAAHGNPQINTPTLDKLYRESAVMNHFFVSPLSAPTRASLLTGRYHLRTGVSSVESGNENMNSEETTLAELFKTNGYETGCFGKWHNGAYYPLTPNGQGFDTFTGFCCGHWSNYFNPLLQHNEEMYRGKGYITDILTDSALCFIDKNKDKPFFCYVPYNAPHSPFQVPDKYFNKYKNIEAKTEKDRNTLACIYGMVENVDDNIQRILTKLDVLDIRKNTIIVFMSDNGPTHVIRYNGNMRGIKGEVHEGSVRVPCYVNWSGQISPRIIQNNFAHIDILPTLMDLCQIKNPKTRFPIDGISFSKILLTGKQKIKDRAIATHKMQDSLNPWLGSVRTNQFRMAVYKNEIMFFDMLKDSTERNNIYDRNNKAQNKIYQSYLKWFNEASLGINTDKTVPIGYPQAKQVRISTPEGKMYGALKCYGYPNQNWVNHFQSKNDSLSFLLNVVSEGNYEVEIEYTLQKKNPDIKIHAISHLVSISAGLPEYISEQLPSPDRVKRGEAYEMTWGKAIIGKIVLEKGIHPITIFASGLMNADDLKIKTLIFNKIESY